MNLYRLFQHGFKDAICPTSLRIIARAMQPGPRPSYQDLMEVTGVTNNAIGWQLRRLRSLGLLDFEDNKYRTVCPTCRFIPADRLGENP